MDALAVTADRAAPSPGLRRLTLVLRLVAAAILGQTLFFKFSAAPESVYIFETLGVEPFGRVASALAELLAVVLLLSPLAAWGALLALGIMVGAVGAHLTLLGIEVQGDGGTLFALALVTLVASAGVAWIRRGDLPLPR